ncbi:MAG: tRNA (adenine(57)-N(1)/adenine(58)-N(1))-methyltransferase TrmI [Methanocella sp. PtaU1.Bin125]|nr:MAG: tRNA (adenine(57)-N(1)/adenine(58)-N(1))-methyltransferase TrmI [Methanocella sp. PtaU1.Bin125]
MIDPSGSDNMTGQADSRSTQASSQTTRADTRSTIVKGEHVLLRASGGERGGREYFTVAGEGKLHTDLGIVDLGAIEGKRWGDTVESHNANAFTIIRPRAPDLFRHLKRTGAPMMPKDIGTIIANTGLCPADTVLDAGTGSGILAAYLGTIAGRVISYEANETFAGNARKNMARAGIASVEVRHGDILEAIKTPELEAEGPFDVITLDMQDAAKAVPGAFRLLRAGGYLAAYSPFFEQATEIRSAVERGGFAEYTTVIVTEQELEVSKRGTRPSTRVGHTGFITIARK